MVKLGCSDYTFPLLSHQAVVDHIRGIGLEAIDLGLFGNRSHLRPETIRLDPAMWVGRIGERLDRAGHIQIREGAPGRMQTTFQENECDFGWMIDRLVALGYDRYMTIEFVWMNLWDCNRTENTMETIQFRDFTRARIEGREYVPFESQI